MSKSITISKLDAAKRQLDTAITLYFHNGDPVSIHTLVSAAYNVIRDVNAIKGGTPMIVKDELIEHVKPEYEKVARKKLNEAENFFKHADRDHKATIDLYPEQSEILMLDAVLQYFRLSREYPPLFKLFQVWFLAHNQNIFKFPVELKQLLSTNLTWVTGSDKVEYFNKVLPMIKRHVVKPLHQIH
jgi:hypothetical protein